MSRVNTELCYHIVKEYYGEIVANVALFLIRSKSTPLGIIVQKTSYDLKQVKQALMTLIKQNIVTFSQTKSGSIDYTVKSEAILWMLRFPHYIHCAKTLFGDAAELLVEELLLQGQSHLGSAVLKTTNKLNESLLSSGSNLPEISQSLIRDKAISLVKARLIRRCEDVVPGTGGQFAVGMKEAVDPEELFTLPTAVDFESTAGLKRPASENVESSAKRIKLEKGEPSGSEERGCQKALEPGYWRVNVYQFHHHFRDQAIIASVVKNIDQRASDVMRTMLRLSETRSNPLSTESEPLSFTEIFNSIPKDKVLQKNVLDQYLKCLSDNCYNFVTKIGESGGGLYQINYFKAIKAICVSHIETIVLERFGSKALRMFRVLLKDKQVEQKQVEERAMLPPKEAKELLYKMFAENFVTLTELSKTPDHPPTRTFYFFHVNLIQVSRMVLERCYQAVTNMMVRRQKCLYENKRLLDKQDRVDAIIASLQAEGAMEQKEEVEQMVTPSERAQLKKIGDAARTLEQSEIQLDQTIFILETYLTYTLHPPVLKK